MEPLRRRIEREPRVFLHVQPHLCLPAECESGRTVPTPKWSLLTLLYFHTVPPCFLSWRPLPSPARNPSHAHFQFHFRIRFHAHAHHPLRSRRPAPPAPPQTNGFTYAIDFQSMTQQNNRTHRLRNIRRVATAAPPAYAATAAWLTGSGSGAAAAAAAASSAAGAGGGGGGGGGGGTWEVELEQYQGGWTAYDAMVQQQISSAITTGQTKVRVYHHRHCHYGHCHRHHHHHHHHCRRRRHHHHHHRHHLSGHYEHAWPDV